ncbi:hypothetical protein ACFU8I_00240 [Streptomyces sp. NPDC057540]|uniref:hypothetical protein n=1 Tax=Streptomyces sp. NPDC057540 TaxID=3346160 RepID=UPI0036C83330
MATVLLTLAVLLAPVSVAATWASSQINDVDRYVRTVAPLARDPAVQDAVTDRVTDEVVARVDVHRLSAYLARVLADRDAPRFLVDVARSSDGQLKSALRTGVRYVVNKTVTSDVFAQAWDLANRGAHTAATNLLAGGDGGAIEIKDDVVELNVGVVVEEMQQRVIGTTLVDADQVPGADTSLVLLRNDRVSDVRDTVRWLGALAPWLPPTVVVLAGTGLWAAPSRRRALMCAAVGTGVTMCGLLVGLSVLRQLCLDAVPPAVTTQAAVAAVYDTLVRFLRQATATALVIALVVALAGYLYGPGRGAEAVRSAAGRGVGTVGAALVRKGGGTGAVGEWLRAHRRSTTVTVAAAGVLALLLWNYPTPLVVAVVLVCVLLVQAVLGVLAAATTDPEG